MFRHSYCVASSYEYTEPNKKTDKFVFNENMLWRDMNYLKRNYK